MDRSEVLDVLNWTAELFDELAVDYTGDPAVSKLQCRSLALRAAADLIRAGGWRPIAEFTDEDEYLTGGRWDQGKWYEYSGKLYWLLANRCTHACLSPEPPAREVPNERG